MRNLLMTLVLTGSMVAAAPAMARGFDSTVEAAVTTPVKIEVMLSEDLAYRADNLPKKLSDRGSARSFNSGFAGKGFYGERDLNRLTEFLEGKLAKDLAKRGITLSETAPVILRVTLEDASPNRPTFTQLGKEPGLSYSSFGTGGAEMKAELVSAGGQSMGTMSYRYFEHDIRDSLHSGTWSDARRSMRRFAKKAAKTLAGTNAS